MSGIARSNSQIDEAPLLSLLLLLLLLDVDVDDVDVGERGAEWKCSRSMMTQRWSEYFATDVAAFRMPRSPSGYEWRAFSVFGVRAKIAAFVCLLARSHTRESD